MSVTKVTGMMQTGTKGGDIPSASTLVIDTDGDYFDITGTTGITAMTVDAGRRFTLQFDGAVTLTHGGSLYLPGATNFTTEANDCLSFIATAANTVRCIGYALKDGGSPVAGAAVFESQLIHVRDQKAAGTHGGAFAIGAWRTRVLNTATTNEITGASLGSNQVTLPAGTYYATASAGGYQVDHHKLRLFDTTSSADLIISMTMLTNGADSTSNHTVLAGRFTISGTKVIELQHRCANTNNTHGFGHATSLDGKIEVYADLHIWKVS